MVQTNGMDSSARNTAVMENGTTAFERARESRRAKTQSLVRVRAVRTFLAAAFLAVLSAMVLFNYIKMVALQKSISDTAGVILKVSRSSESMTSKILEGKNYSVIRETVVSAGFKERKGSEGVTVDLSRDNFPLPEITSDDKN